jgi:hypothetical protein
LAERQRRFRQRRHAHIIVVPVEVSGVILDLLVDAKWIAEPDTLSSEKVGAAIAWGLGLLAQTRALR